MLADFSHVVQHVLVYTHYVLVIFSSGTCLCKSNFSPVRCMPTLLCGGKWYFCFFHFTFLTVHSGSTRLWMTLIFKLNSIDLHNVSLTVVKVTVRSLSASLFQVSAHRKWWKEFSLLEQEVDLGGDLIALHKSSLIKYFMFVTLWVPYYFSGLHRLKKRYCWL